MSETGANDGRLEMQFNQDVRGADVVGPDGGVYDGRRWDDE